MITLLQILNHLAAFFGNHGAPHAAVLSVSQHLGWLESKHWIIRVCWRGSAGCHL
jgi:hypothetical protein